MLHSLTWPSQIPPQRFVTCSRSALSHVPRGVMSDDPMSALHFYDTYTSISAYAFIIHHLYLHRMAMSVTTFISTLVYVFISPYVSCRMVVYIYIYAYYETDNYDHHICCITTLDSPNFLRGAPSHVPEACCHMPPAAYCPMTLRRYHISIILI